MLSNACPKPKPAALERKAARAKVKTTDEAENRKVKARSGGRCEAYICATADSPWSRRCGGRAVHVHHKIGGWRRRGKAESALAINKLHLCESCHRDVHSHVLVPLADGTFRRVG